MVRNYLYHGLLLFFLLSSAHSVGQTEQIEQTEYTGQLKQTGQTKKERKADRNFDTYAYIDAIKAYEDMVDRGLANTSILSKLGDAYYFNGKFEEAFNVYNELFQGHYGDKDLSSLDKEYYYRYAQTLKAVNEVAKADEVLQRFAQRYASDSRSKMFITHEELVEKTLTASRYTLVNLEANSENSDYGASLLDGNFIFTSSRENEEMKNKVHNWTNQQYTKLYALSIGEDGSFGKPALFAKEIASKELNMGSAIFTKDGGTMYFTSNKGALKGGKRTQYNADDSSVLKIYRSKKQANGSWGTPEELSFNLEEYNTAHPALTPDEKWLYFVSDRQGSLGQSDLFRVSMFETGRFGAVEHLGDQVNTAGRETFPFISEDYMLYFSSDGLPGFGGLDLFRSKLNRDGQIGVPVNLGPDINSTHDDFSIYLDAATRKGFVSSNKPGGKGGDDIYLFIEEACIQLLDGIVSDVDSNEGIAAVELSIYDRHQKLIETVHSDENGYYQVSKLACSQQYSLQVRKENYFERDFVVDTDRGAHQRLNIELEKIKKGDDLFKKLKLAPIHFDFNKWDIRPDAQVELQKVVDVMLQHPALQVDVRSHTDSRGNDAYNMQLSNRRAQATIQWMISRGIDASRLTGRGYGESQLVNHCGNGVNCTDEEHQENRRSEFIIMNM